MHADLDSDSSSPTQAQPTSTSAVGQPDATATPNTGPTTGPATATPAGPDATATPGNPGGGSPEDLLNNHWVLKGDPARRARLVEAFGGVEETLVFLDKFNGLDPGWLAGGVSRLEGALDVPPQVPASAIRASLDQMNDSAFRTLPMVANILALSGDVIDGTTTPQTIVIGGQVQLDELLSRNGATRLKGTWVSG